MAQLTLFGPLVIAGSLMVLGIAAAMIWSLVSGSRRKGRVLFIGIRPSTGGIHLRRGRPTRGRYTWKEPGEHNMDIYMDAAFSHELTSPKDPEMRAVLVDLDTGHVLRYMGRAGNDTEQVQTTYKGKPYTITGVWRRLPGTRLYKIRKDMRIDQMAQISTSIWTSLVKIVPIALIIIGVVLVIIMGVLVKGVM